MIDFYKKATKIQIAGLQKSSVLVYIRVVYISLYPYPVPEHSQPSLEEEAVQKKSSPVLPGSRLLTSFGHSLWFYFLLKYNVNFH